MLVENFHFFFQLGLIKHLPLNIALQLLLILNILLETILQLAVKNFIYIPTRTLKPEPHSLNELRDGFYGFMMVLF